MPKKQKLPARPSKGQLGWKATSSDGKYLRTLLQTRKISKGASPKLIVETYPQFAKYKAESFRAGLRRLKSEVGFHVRDHGK
jgi:hypothetical protein